MESNNTLPVHIGIIMDGNRRWAKNHFLPTFQGHSKGAEVFKNIAIHCNEIGDKYLTVYAFSTENWKRSEEEVSYLMRLFGSYLKDVINEKLGKENIKIKFIGAISKLPEKIRKLIAEAEEKSSQNTGLNLNIAVNYGGREEIANAAKILAQEVKEGKITPEEITEKYLETKLYSAGQPDVDLIIRTANEQRTSNFMIWKSAYAELYFTPVLWPDFNEKELEKALKEFSGRTRRFGGA